MKNYFCQSLLILIVLLGGCMTTPHVVTTGDKAFPLLSPASLGSVHQVTQQLHGEYGDKSFSLQCPVSVDARKLTLICLTSMGLRAFTLNYDGHDITEQRAPQVPDALQASRLLNDLQLAFWPLSVLQQSWRSTGVEVVEPFPGTRRVMRDGKIITEVHYSSDPWQGRVWLHQNEIGYSLYIESGED
jgi:hypothetical protein